MLRIKVHSLVFHNPSMRYRLSQFLSHAKHTKIPNSFPSTLLKLVSHKLCVRSELLQRSHLHAFSSRLLYTPNEQLPDAPVLESLSIGAEHEVHTLEP